MRLTQSQLAQLETPCLVVDVAQVRRNIAKMQQAVARTGCALRPHIKTHKMPLFARMQVEAGACGITCAKVSEAEVMAAGGLRDIFIAYPLVGAFRIRRALALARHLDRLILAVDSLPGAEALSEAAAAAGQEVEIRLEIDTGAGRTGIPLSEAAALACRIARLPGLRLTGIYTFKSLVYRGAPTEDTDLAAREEGELMAEAARRLRAAGVEIRDISAGSTPTALGAAQTGLVTEVRPGTYLFNDLLLCQEHAATPDEIAVRYAATVISANHPDYAVLDGGCKTFSTDLVPNTPPYYFPGYAAVEGHPDLYLQRMNEEHGMVVAAEGQTGLQTGEILTLLPLHVCTAVNLQNSLYLLWEDGHLTREAVAARGCTV